VAKCAEPSILSLGTHGFCITASLQALLPTRIGAAARGLEMLLSCWRRRKGFWTCRTTFILLPTSSPSSNAEIPRRSPSCSHLSVEADHVAASPAAILQRMAEEASQPLGILQKAASAASASKPVVMVDGLVVEKSPDAGDAETAAPQPAAAESYDLPLRR